MLVVPAVRRFIECRRVLGGALGATGAPCVDLRPFDACARRCYLIFKVLQPLQLLVRLSADKYQQVGIIVQQFGGWGLEQVLQKGFQLLFCVGVLDSYNLISDQYWSICLSITDTAWSVKR